MGDYQNFIDDCKQLKAEQVVLQTQNANLAMRLRFLKENLLQQHEQPLDANIQWYVASPKEKTE